MTAYYNENDPFAAAWLRNLISAGEIAPGDVDERSIEDVKPVELMGYRQCHFFAGVGIWSAALRGAGWPDDLPVWTASCPCQPFSTSGKGEGFDDERHLWPSLFHNVEVCGPGVMFGEQVESKDGLAWLDLISSDLEAVGYACGAVPFPAAGVGAPHPRHRNYWVADANNQRLEGRFKPERERSGELIAWPGGLASGLDNAISDGRRAGGNGYNSGDVWQKLDTNGPDGRLAHAHVNGRGEAGERFTQTGNDGAFGNGLIASGSSAAREANGRWGNSDWLFCRDGKWRPVDAGTFPLAHGDFSRVGRLRAYGNAIVKPQAEAFIRAYMEIAS